MMTNLYIIFSLAVVLLQLPHPGLTQSLQHPQDSVMAKTKAVSYYRDGVGAESVLYEGREYLGFDHQIQGHAFFLTSDWQPSSLYYKGQYYQNIPLLYDIAAEEVVVRHSGGMYKIKLIRQKIGYFSLNGHEFFRLDTTDARGTRMPAGFYDLMYAGKLKVWVKRKKMVKESIRNMQVVQDFVATDQYYLQKEGNYYPINTRSAALNLMQDKKKELRRFLRKNEIFYKRDPEVALIKMAALYDQLTQNNP